MVVRRLSLLLAITFVLSALSGLSGCKEIQKLLPATEVTDPEAGSPEWVIQQYVKSCLFPTTEEGWRFIRPHMHTQTIGSPSAESSYRSMNYEASCRKVKNFLEDPKKPVFYIDYDERMDNQEETRRFYLINQKSDLPTPCTVRRDHTQNNDFKIYLGCL